MVREIKEKFEPEGEDGEEEEEEENAGGKRSGVGSEREREAKEERHVVRWEKKHTQGEVIEERQENKL